MNLLFVLIAYRLDLAIGTKANELISTVENAGLMGLPLPAVLIKAIDILKKKAEVTE
jgi:phage-related holin